MPPSPASARNRPSGFTRLELLVVVGTIALVTLVSWPARGAGGSVRTTVCMDSLRRLAAAWVLYAQDNADRMVGNYTGGFVPTPGARERPWATGWLDWSTSSDNTNTVYLTESRYAALAAYAGREPTLFRCPADEYMAASQLSRSWLARVRSYSMNCYVGEGNALNGPIDSSDPIVTQLGGFRGLAPQNTFVFAEEHPDSLNDPMLYVSMTAWQWTDLPGSFHDGAGTFAFGDGHVELHAWRSATTLRSVRFTYSNNMPLPPNDPDLSWVRGRATAR